VLPAEWIGDMALDPVVFALANPDPETDVDAARKMLGNAKSASSVSPVGSVGA